MIATNILQRMAKKNYTNNFVESCFCFFLHSHDFPTATMPRVPPPPPPSRSGGPSPHVGHAPPPPPHQHGGRMAAPPIPNRAPKHSDGEN